MQEKNIIYGVFKKHPKYQKITQKMKIVFVQLYFYLKI